MFSPGEKAPAVEVVEIVAVGVGFAFERYVAIGPVPVSVLNHPEEPFNDIQDIEGYEKKFVHLCCVDTFVVDDVAVDPTGVARPKCAEKVDAYSFRHNRAANDFVFFQ